MAGQLSGCWRKIERADEHIQWLDRERSRLSESHGVLQKREPETASYVYEILPSKRLDWGIVSGEVAHNLRSCLDHLAWQLALLNVEGERQARTRGEPWPPKRNEFPIFKDASVYQGEREGKTRGFLPHHADVIDALQPCNRSVTPETDPLWVLHRLNNVDKHRVLHAAVMNIERLPEFPVEITGTGLKQMPGYPPIDVEWARSDGTEKYMKGVPFEITFEDRGEPFHERRVVPLLNALRREVTEIVRRFSSEFS